MDDVQQVNPQSQALLEELRDIGSPEPPPWWPPAPGWWGVGIFTLFLLLLCFWVARRFWRARLYRKEAKQVLADLHSAWESNRDAHAFASGAHQLLRRVAIHHAGRERFSRLTGQSFIDQVNLISNSTLTANVGASLTDASYRPNGTIDVDSIRSEISEWIDGLGRRERA